jgi:2'-5' RNA ligase
METVRAFIAVDIGGDARSKLAKLQRQLQRTHADVKWVKVESIHLTLAFLGNVPIDSIRPLEAAMDQAFQGQETFDLKVAGTGTFGKPKHPRVIWAGIEECPPLMQLQEKTVEALHAADVQFDAKPFSPHLTLGRVKSFKHISALLDALVREKDVEFGCVQISEVLLIKSKLKPGGAEYTVLHRAVLS